MNESLTESQRLLEAAILMLALALALVASTTPHAASLSF